MCQVSDKAIEHFENRIIMLFGQFENEIEPIVMQVMVQEICAVQEN